MLQRMTLSQLFLILGKHLVSFYFVHTINLFLLLQRRERERDRVKSSSFPCFFMGYFLVHSFLILTSLLCSSAYANPELRALMELKTSLDPDGRILSSWSSNGDPCKGDFEGVACNEHGKVANISLQGKGLMGSLSPALSHLKCLNGLYLHYNGLKGEIPREITNLTELVDLYLNQNNLTGTIPSEIGNMASLQGNFFLFFFFLFQVN